MRREKWIFYFMFWTAVRAREEPLYKKIGDKVVLTPDSVENPITNIIWMYGNDIAMEWYQGKTLSLQQFKDRGSLDISTGVMTITGLTRDDSGIYTAEINGKETSETELLVISPVPKPTISVSCERTYCVYICDGNTTGTEPVTYWWTADEKRWPSTKELKITKEDKEQWFSCELENHVSSSSSEKVINLFRKELLYRKIGDKAVLTPDSVENPIYRVVWKHGPNIAMQWWHEETSSYRQFKDHGSLDISTGEMTITGLTRDDSGIYTAEINNRVPSKTLLLVISPVPKPTIYISCDPEMTHCVLTCDGSTTDAEPVTYWWTAGEKKWPSIKQLKITKEDKEEWFRCRVENPVSSISSEKICNPFMSDQTWIYILTPLVVVSLVVCIFIIYLKRKCRKAMQVMLSDFKNTFNLSLASVVTHCTSNGADLTPQWEFAGKRGRWHDFREKIDPPNICSVTIDDIESWYQENPHGKLPFTVNGDSYELDFNKMIQTQVKDNSQYSIRRVLLPLHAHV
ncbi:uncharacterized protein LOC128354439 isoform X2 [Scomber japonicus]|uniref:uncharacterized protein LOC128354439 isoform X2 n=1 Tax=Scomber japonicus TaxID=13676 RepID=UPI0023063128|nr:uncharacterized protein LOC128354439 isoform X2 [Scomber japonicus]